MNQTKYAFQKNFILKILTIVSIAINIFGCASGDKKDSETAEFLFQKAQDLVKDERYEEAIRKFQDIKNKFPYSKLAVESELLIADSYYNQESFPEAQASYQLFKELHPKHNRIDYVTYKIGLSYFNQLPSTIDRDLTLAKNAIQSFDLVLNKYSSTEFVADSQKKKNECLKMLAQKEIYIGNFYFKKLNYESALGRYKSAFVNYGGLGFDPESKNNAIEAAKKNNNELLIKDFSSIIISTDELKN